MNTRADLDLGALRAFVAGLELGSFARGRRLLLVGRDRRHFDPGEATLAEFQIFEGRSSA